MESELLRQMLIRNEGKSKENIKKVKGPIKVKNEDEKGIK
jgi:hypothetical protein